MSKHKVDINHLFRMAGDGDFGFINSLTDEEIKAMSPYVLLMWEGTDDNIERCLLVNEWCNDKVFSLSQHPRLLLKLYVAAHSVYGRTRPVFEKSVGARESAIITTIARHYEVGYDEARDLHRLLDKEDIKQLTELYDV